MIKIHLFILLKYEVKRRRANSVVLSKLNTRAIISWVDNDSHQIFLQAFTSKFSLKLLSVVACTNFGKKIVNRF